MSWAVEFTQDILSLVALGVGLVAGIYMQLPIPWEHVLLVAVGGLGALVVLFWFVLSV